MSCSIKKQSSPTLEEVTHVHIAKAIRQAIKESVDQEVKNRQEELSELSQRQIQTEESVDQEVKNRQEDLSELFQRQIQMEEFVDQEVKNRQEELAELSKRQIQMEEFEGDQVVENTAQETIEQPVENTTQNTINIKFSNLEKKLENMFQEQMESLQQVLGEDHDTSKEVELTQLQDIISKEMATQITVQFVTLSDLEREDLNLKILEEVGPIVREVLDNVLEEMVENKLVSQTESMEFHYKKKLKMGFQTILSAAIHTVVDILSSKENLNEMSSRQNKIDETIEASTSLAFSEFGLQDKAFPMLSSHLAFEQCDWKNKDYTTRIIQDHTFFNYKDPFTSLVHRWEEFKKTKNNHHLSCSSFPSVVSYRNEESQPICPQKNAIEEEFDYLSPLYDEFVLSFFKESIQEKQLSENDVPSECFFAGAVRGANIYTSTNSYYYCEEDSVYPSHMTVKDDQQKTRVIAPQRACLNRDYTFLTAKAFNKTADCFGFNKSDKEMIFKLFNHESSFLHNVKSSTSARCYGQLTTIALEEINKQIYFSNSKNPFPYSFIFDEVIEQCPGLQTAVLNSEIYEPRNKKNMKHFQSLFAKTAINCKITQNPYTCLFYAFYNIKINMVNIEKQLEGATSSFGENNNIPEDFKNTFSLPILLSEMRGVTNIKGKNMIFWDDSEIWGSLKNKPTDQMENIRRLPLFSNEAEVKNIFNLWAYNGGVTISTYMENFIKQLKRSIARPCSPQASSKTCQYRFAVQAGQGIATKDIKKDFQAYILRNYKTKKGQKRRFEVKNFVHLVETHLNYIYNKNGAFRYHLKELVPELTNKDVEEFQDYLQGICPEVDSTLL